MKKLILLFAAGAIALNAGAQYRSTIDRPSEKIVGDREINVNGMRKEIRERYETAGARKTTGPGGSRWYNYGFAMDTSTAYAISLGGGTGTANTAQTIWNDTNGLVNYTSGLAHNIFVSQASVFDPKARLFNMDPSAAYVGQIKITSSDAYTCDSADIYAVYEYNKTKTTVVDTLKLMFTKGNGSSMSSTNIFSGAAMGTGGHYPSVTFLDIIYDSVTNRGSGTQAADLHYQQILLNNGGSTPAWGDTLSNGTWVKRVAVNGASGISCAGGDLLGMSVTFVSGDPATKTGVLSTPTPSDTLVSDFDAGENQYCVWRPLIKFYADAGGTTAQWAPYLATATPVADHNAGYWKTLPSYKQGWDSLYVPLWAWNSGGNASGLQHPIISWHITCGACDLITDAYLGVNNTSTIGHIYASPNPSDNKLNISLSLAKSSDVSVTLTNMLGQVVATEKLSGITNGIATFNTSSLPAGFYVYNVEANGEKATGRVVVAH